MVSRSTLPASAFSFGFSTFAIFALALAAFVCLAVAFPHLRLGVAFFLYISRALVFKGLNPSVIRTPHVLPDFFLPLSALHFLAFDLLHLVYTARLLRFSLPPIQLLVQLFFEIFVIIELAKFLRK